MFQNGVSFDECQLREPALQTPSLFIPSTLRMREFSVSTLLHPLLLCSAPAFFFLPRWIYYYLLQGKNMRLVFRSRIGSCEKLLILRDIIESALITFSFSERQLKICWPLSFFLKKRKQFKNSDRGIIWLFQFVTNMSRVSQSYAFHLGCHETVT